MSYTCVLHQNFYKLHEWLVQKNDDKATILIVDDDIDTLTVTGRILGHAGFKVHAFADPLTALQHIHDNCKILPSLGI